MKAYKVTDGRYCDFATIVFAESRGKAKKIAQNTDCCEYTPFIYIRATRVPALDKYYRGISEMDWYEDNDRIAMVKEANFSCSYEYDALDCECDKCPANQWCDRSGGDTE